MARVLCVVRSHLVLRMEEFDPALFTKGGTARGAYQPLIDLDLDLVDASSTVDHHTSDVNDQHSSCDVHGDCAASHSSLMSAPTVLLSSVQFGSSASYAAPRDSLTCI